MILRIISEGLLNDKWLNNSMVMVNSFQENF